MTPERAPSSPPRAPAPEDLREWARSHPVVRALVAALPARPRPGGLRADVTRAPAMTLGDRVRVSVLRLVSVTEEGEELVGQVQVTEDAGDATTRVARYYVHDRDHYSTRTMDDADAWWVAVLDAHYARGGRAVEL